MRNGITMTNLIIFIAVMLILVTTISTLNIYITNNTSNKLENATAASGMSNLVLYIDKALDEYELDRNNVSDNKLKFYEEGDLTGVPIVTIQHKDSYLFYNRILIAENVTNFDFKINDDKLENALVTQIVLDGNTYVNTFSLNK